LPKTAFGNAKLFARTAAYGFRCDSHYRARAEIQWVEFAAGKKPFTWSRQGKLRNKKGTFLDVSAKWSAMLAPQQQARVAEH
jgi:hypothetical protein